MDRLKISPEQLKEWVLDKSVSCYPDQSDYFHQLFVIMKMLVELKDSDAKDIRDHQNNLYLFLKGV